MKICRLCPFPGSSEFHLGLVSYMYHLTLAQAKLKHDVTVISDESEKFGEKSTYKGIKIYRFPGKRKGIYKYPPFSSLYFGLNSYKILKKINGFDIIHGHNPVVLGFAFKKHKIKIPFVFTIHGNVKSPSFNEIRRDIHSIPFYHFAKYIAKKADAVITVSKQSRDYVLKNFKIKNVFYVPTGVDTKMFNPKIKPTIKNKKNKTVLYVGRYTKGKGLDILLKAASIVVKQNPETNFILLGADKNNVYNELFVLRKKLGLEKNVIFKEPVPHDKIASYYTSSYVFAFPSYGEGTPKVVLEAMSCGLPVVASEVGGISDIIKNKKDGFLVSPKDHKTLAEYILLLLNNRKKYLEISRKARQKVINSYTWDKIALQVDKVYDSVLKS